MPVVPVASVDLNGQVQALANRYTVLHESASERAACANALLDLANSDAVVQRASSLLTPQTIAHFAQELASVVANATDDDSGTVGGTAAWPAHRAYISAACHFLANCCLGDDALFRRALLRDGAIVLTLYALLEHLAALGKGQAPAAAASAPSRPGTAGAAQRPGSAAGRLGAPPAPAPGPQPLTPDQEAAFAALDLAATLSTNSGELRTALGDAGIIELVVDVCRANKTCLDVLFGAAATLANATLGDTINCRRVVHCNGLQVAVAVTIWCCAREEEGRRQRAASAGGSARASVLAVDNSGNGDNEDAAGVTTEERAAAAFAAAVAAEAAAQEQWERLLRETKRWFRQTLMHVVKCPSDAVDTALAQASFGRFGQYVDVDDLKFAVVRERKRCLALLESFRQGRIGGAGGDDAAGVRPGSAAVGAARPATSSGQSKPSSATSA